MCTVGLCCLLLGGCADSAGNGPESYVVRPRDTLYSIAWRHDLDFRDLARWNNIGPDFRISVGQVLALGPGASRSPSASRGPSASPSSSPSGSASPSGGASPSAGRAPTLGNRAPRTPVTAGPDTAASRAPELSQVGKPRPPSESQAAKWVWPTDGVGAPRPVPGGGILLSGRLGQDVRAASAGRVVYTGSGLRGYGNLIIIKHAESLLSAYAHNREMLVHDGQEVASGQVIGHMGEDAHQAPILYFEIRQNGRPIDPLPFFPQTK
jgi:lipoprotein NlpD